MACVDGMDTERLPWAVYPQDQYESQKNEKRVQEAQTEPLFKRRHAKYQKEGLRRSVRPGQLGGVISDHTDAGRPGGGAARMGALHIQCDGSARRVAVKGATLVKGAPGSTSQL